MLQEYLSDLKTISVLTAITSFLLVYYLIPKIIWMVDYHSLGNEPGERDSHINIVPTMGGLSFFITLILAIFFFKNFDVDGVGLNLVAAITIVFIIGLKDDLSLSSPRARILVETMAILILFFYGGFHSNSFDGFLGIYEVPDILKDGFNVILLLGIINAYNLIDGVDGLASFLGIITFSFFGFFFYKTGLQFYFLISLSLIFILLSFLRYNLSHKVKIFMGDTGSLIIGFCIAFLSLKFLTMDSSLMSHFNFKIENRLYVVAAVISMQLFDTLRVFCIRILKKGNPFKADRNHIHHILLDLGYRHITISFIIGALNIIIAILLIYLSSIFNSYTMLLIFGLLFLVLVLVFHKLKIASRKKLNPV